MDLSKVTEVNPLASSKMTYGELDQAELTMPVHGQVADTLTVDSGSGPSTVAATAEVNATVNFSEAEFDPFVDFP